MKKFVCFVFAFALLFSLCPAGFAAGSASSHALNMSAEELDALYDEALCLYSGEGCERDFSACFALLSRAAAQNHAPSMHLLAYMYYLGLGTEASIDMAYEFLTRAAEQGEISAVLDMARALEEGIVPVEDSSAKALELYTFAAEAGSIEAMNYLGDCYADENIWPAPMVAADELEALDWYLSAAEAGDPRATCVMGFIFQNGRGVRQSDEKALEWFTKSAEAGFVPAMFALCEVYYYGMGTAPDESAAADWYRRGIEAGSTLPLILRYDRVCQLDPALAASLAGQCADMGDGTLLYRQGAAAFDRGENGTALDCLSRAAELGSEDAAMLLADMYRLSDGVERDREQADKWLELADSIRFERLVTQRCYRGTILESLY